MSRVTSYTITYYGSDASSSGGSSSGESGGYRGSLAQIFLFHDTDHLGYINVLKDGVPVPNDYMADGRIAMHVRASMLDAIYTTLRSEKLIHFELVTTDHTAHAVLKAGKYPA
jgi:hypothetical protein